MTREKCINASEEEVRKWIFEVPINTKEFWRRHNFVYYDCGLSRLGINIKEPICCGELICEYE